MRKEGYFAQELSDCGLDPGPHVHFRLHRPPMSLRKNALCILAALALGLTYALAPGLAGAAPEKPSGGLPLGKPGLQETRITEKVAAGVTYTKIVRGKVSGDDFYTVDVAFEADRAAAEGVAAQLRSDGYEPVIVEVSDRASDDPARGPLGFLVRTGSFATQAGADALRAELTAKGYTGLRTVYTGEDGTETTGPWVVHVLEVDPDRYDGTLEPELATKVVPERELLTAISARTDSLAAVNGGYFVIGANDGTPGDLAGISVLDGALISEAVDGRTSLVLPKETAKGPMWRPSRTPSSATSSDGAMRVVDGKNRKPGLDPGCGGDGGDAPTELPRHDFTCTDGSELILFTPIFGASTEPGDGAEAVLDASGRWWSFARAAAAPSRDSVFSPERAPAGCAPMPKWAIHQRLGEVLGRWRDARRRDWRHQRWSAACGRWGGRDHRLRRRLRLPGEPGVLLPLRRTPQPAHPRWRYTRREPAPRRRGRPRSRLQRRRQLRGERYRHGRPRGGGGCQPRRRRLHGHDTGPAPRGRPSDATWGGPSAMRWCCCRKPASLQHLAVSLQPAGAPRRPLFLVLRTPIKATILRRLYEADSHATLSWFSAASQAVAGYSSSKRPKRGSIRNVAPPPFAKRATQHDK